MRYDLTSLDIFITVAEERNLTRVGRMKHLAVSAISKRVSELESQVGAPLLVRNARGVDLTPAGQSLLFYARQVRQTLAQLDQELGDYTTGVKGHLRIHAITSALSQFLPQDIADFVSIYPQIKLTSKNESGRRSFGRSRMPSRSRHHCQPNTGSGFRSDSVSQRRAHLGCAHWTCPRGPQVHPVSGSAGARVRRPSSRKLDAHIADQRSRKSLAWR